jgi:hypothetical protein
MKMLEQDIGKLVEWVFLNDARPETVEAKVQWYSDNFFTLAISFTEGSFKGEYSEGKCVLVGRKVMMYHSNRFYDLTKDNVLNTVFRRKPANQCVCRV